MKGTEVGSLEHLEVLCAAPAATSRQLADHPRVEEAQQHRAHDAVGEARRRGHHSCCEHCRAGFADLQSGGRDVGEMAVVEEGTGSSSSSSPLEEFTPLA